MTAGFGELALFQTKVGKAALSLLRDVRWQFAQPGKVGEGAKGMAIDTQRPKAATFVEKMFAQIERPAHDTASLLRPGGACYSMKANYNETGNFSKLYR
jgi:hypothetical protein